MDACSRMTVLWEDTAESVRNGIVPTGVSSYMSTFAFWEVLGGTRYMCLHLDAAIRLRFQMLRAVLERGADYNERA